MSWDEDPFLDAMSNNDVEDSDMNNIVGKGILGQDYLTDNSSSNWWFRDPYSERLAAEKFEREKTTEAQAVQKDSSSPFYDLSEKFVANQSQEPSVDNTKNTVFLGVNFSPSHSTNNINDTTDNSLEGFGDLEYADKFTRSPEYDPSVPEPPKKIIRPESAREFPKKSSDTSGPSKRTLVPKAHSLESTIETAKPGVNSSDKKPFTVSQKAFSSKGDKLNNGSVKENLENNNFNDKTPKEATFNNIDNNAKLAEGAASTQETVRTEPECDHWGTSTFSWDSPPRVPSKPTSSWNSPPRVPSKPTSSWNSPSPVPSKPPASRGSPSRDPSKSTTSWNSPLRVPSKPTPSWDSPPRVPSKPTPSWDSPPRVSSKPSASWDSPPHVPSKPSASRGSHHVSSKPTASWDSPPHVPSRQHSSRGSPARASSKPTSSCYSPPRVPSRSNGGSLPNLHKKPFSQSSLRPQTNSNTASFKSKANFSSKPSNFNSTSNSTYIDKKPAANYSSPKASTNSELQVSSDQVWEDGFLEAAKLLLDHIPGTHLSSCIDQIRKKYPQVLNKDKDQIKKPRFNCYRPSFVSVSVSENVGKTSKPSTRRPSVDNSNPTELNVNQINYLRRLQALEANVSPPQNFNGKSYLGHSVSPRPPIRNNSTSSRATMSPNPRTYNSTQPSYSYHPPSSQRGRQRNNSRSSSHDHHHVASRVASRVDDATSFDLLDINTSLVELVMSNERFLGYESLPSRVRDRVIRLAKEYGLKAHCSGSGATLALNLEKVSGTCIPENTLAIQALLATPLDDPVDVPLLKKMMSAGKTQWQGWSTHS